MRESKGMKKIRKEEHKLLQDLKKTTKLLGKYEELEEQKQEILKEVRKLWGNSAKIFSFRND